MADKEETGSEQMVGWIILLVIILICLYFTYKTITPEVHSLIRWIRYAELWLISLVTSDDYNVVLSNGDAYNVVEWRDGIKALPATAIDINLIGLMSAIALKAYKWVVVGVIGLIALWGYTKGPTSHFTTVHSLDSFIKFQASSFPVIFPFIKFNPANQPPRPPGADVPAELPPFAEALGPEEWIAYNQIKIVDKDMDKNSVYKAFARQLGPRWKGYKKLAPYKQVLLAAFCLKASRKREESDDMTGRLARCWSHDGGLNLSAEKGLLRDARRVLANKDLSHKVLKKCNQHAWQTTALLRALATAREEGGVMAPAQFVWLRAHDRTLWYPLNNLGRQSNHAEAIGATAHYKQEKRAQRPIPKPKVQDAVTSIVDYINGGTARPIPSLDYSKSTNKRGIKKIKGT